MIVNRQPLHYPTFCAELAQRMPCQHELARPRKKGVKPNGSIYYRRQCPTCGAALRPSQLSHQIVKNFVSAGGIVEDWDVGAQEAYNRARCRHADEIRRKYAWDREGWWTRYMSYLVSDEWRTRRERILERDDYLCRRCAKSKATQVHHITYERAGNELDSDLESLCSDCHGAIHAKSSRGPVS